MWTSELCLILVIVIETKKLHGCDKVQVREPDRVLWYKSTISFCSLYTSFIVEKNSLALKGIAS